MWESLLRKYQRWKCFCLDLFLSKGRVVYLLSSPWNDYLEDGTYELTEREGSGYMQWFVERREMRERHHRQHPTAAEDRESLQEEGISIQVKFDL